MTLQQAVSAERVVRTCLHCKNAPVQLGRAYCDECLHELLNGDCAAPGCKHEKSALATAPPEQAAPLREEEVHNAYLLGLAGQAPSQGGIPPYTPAGSAGALSDSFTLIVKDLREAKVESPLSVKRPLKQALNWIADRIEQLLEATPIIHGQAELAAHDQKVRAEAQLEELKSLLTLVHGTQQHIPLTDPENCQFQICVDINSRIRSLAGAEEKK